MFFKLFSDTEARVKQDKFKQLVDRLDRELQNTDITDQEILKKLNQLMDDVQAKLDHPSDKESHQKALNNLKDSALKIEAQHPKLTSLMNEISNYLSSLGI